MEADSSSGLEAAGTGDVDDHRVGAESVAGGCGEMAEDAVAADCQKRRGSAVELVDGAMTYDVDAIVLGDQTAAGEAMVDCSGRYTRREKLKARDTAALSAGNPSNQPIVASLENV